MAKTSDIIAERAQNICWDMPRSYQVLVSDTYMNAMKNVVPTLLGVGTVKDGAKEFIMLRISDLPPTLSFAYKPEAYKRRFLFLTVAF